MATSSGWRGCSVPRCYRPHKAKGLCARHYWRAYHGRPMEGTPRMPAPWPTCALCGDFVSLRRYTICGRCQRAQNSVRAARARWDRQRQEAA